MKKTILITGATDGIGLKTAQMLAPMGHTLLIHGRNPEKLQSVMDRLSNFSSTDLIKGLTADLSDMISVKTLTDQIFEEYDKLDVLINNAGVYKVETPVTCQHLDSRFAVNTLAPYLLTKQLLPLFDSAGRVINLSSAAQAPFAPKELSEPSGLNDDMVYAKSKLALTMWSTALGLSFKDKGPAVIAVNPASFLGSKMVKQAYGVEGKDLGIGASILVQAALSEEFANASGKYFDNDSGQFSRPHPHALDPEQCRSLIREMEEILARTTL